jgi:hypothetical protein
MKKRFLLFGIILAIVALTIVFFGARFSELIDERKAEKDEFNFHLKEARSVYTVFDKDKKIEFARSSADDYEGLGLMFGIKLNVIFIIGVLENSPADRAGLEVGDKIIKIDDSYASKMTAEEISNALKGKKGTKVKLNIYRDSFGDESQNFIITRDIIDNSEGRKHFLFFREGQGGEDLGNNYRKYEGKIYYWNDSGKKSELLVNANPETFISLENKDCAWEKNESGPWTCRNYAMDNARVFYGWYEIEDADPTTFQILKESFAKDKNGYYLRDSRIDESRYLEFMRSEGSEFGNYCCRRYARTYGRTYADK